MNLTLASTLHIDPPIGKHITVEVFEFRPRLMTLLCRVYQFPCVFLVFLAILFSGRLLALVAESIKPGLQWLVLQMAVIAGLTCVSVRECHQDI